MGGMVSIALQSAVRPKPPEEKKVRFSFSLSQEAYDKLVEAARSDRRSVSAKLDNILWEFFGITKQINPDDEAGK
jgi:hypothetical protein